MKTRSRLLTTSASLCMVVALIIYYFMGVKVLVVNKMTDTKIDELVCFELKGDVTEFGIIRGNETKSKFLLLSSGQVMKCRLEISGYESIGNDFLIIGYYTEELSKVFINVIKEKDDVIVKVMHVTSSGEKEVNSSYFFNKK